MDVSARQQPVDPSADIDVLIRFGRLASDVAPTEILHLLADAAVEHVLADGAVVVEVGDRGRLRAIATSGTPAGALVSWDADADGIGEELESVLLRDLRRWGGSFAVARTLPLVSPGELFGALVLLYDAEDAEQQARLHLAEGLADLAAIAVSRANQLAKLEHANAELRRSEAALRQSERLRSLGQMAAGVAHDLRNILNPLWLHAQIISRAAAAGHVEQVATTAEEMRAVIKRGVETLERLRAFSRHASPVVATEVHLDELAREAIAIARPRMMQRPGVSIDIVEDLRRGPAVVARPDEVVAAIVNLLANAIDAMSGGGTLTVRTCRAQSPADGAAIAVSDTGPGMGASVKRRIFEPFFTTKGADGTGLGLAMVSATMQRCGGRVELDTAPGKGAKFTLLFPPARR